ncbi:MAG: ribonuclease E activity regulator RraA [Maricaulaceae bacterium]|jgi:regulator of ribonuclease activity A
MIEPVPVCDVCDALGERARVLDPVFRDFGGRMRFAGPVSTVKCFEDNSKVKEAVNEQGEGRVLVVDGGGAVRRSLVGGDLASTAAGNGWAGLVVYGAVRDADELCEAFLGIKALGLIPVKTEKRGLGDRDVAVTFAGQTIRPGDVLYADADGIVVLEEAYAP